MRDGRAVTGGATASSFVQVLGVNLTEHSRPFQLFFCCSGIFFGFMINGVCEVGQCVGSWLWEVLIFVEWVKLDL